MFDPITLDGAVAAVSQIATSITVTISDLAEVRRKLPGSDRLVGLLISELSTVKAALIQIEDWVKYNASRGPAQGDVARAFGVSLEGCHRTLSLLQEEVVRVLQGLSPSSSPNTYARCAWNESSMEDHRQRLHTQVGALQLLVQAFQIRTLHGQAALLREPRSRQILQKIEEDTSSLSTSVTESTVLGSIRTSSPAPSTLTVPTIASFERQLLNTRAYSRRNRSPEHTERRSPTEPRSAGWAFPPTQPRTDLDRSRSAGHVFDQSRSRFGSLADDETDTQSRVISERTQKNTERNANQRLSASSIMPEPPLQTRDPQQPVEPEPRPTTPKRQLRIHIPEEEQRAAKPIDRSAISEPASAFARHLRLPSANPTQDPTAQVDYYAYPKSADTGYSPSRIWNAITRRKSKGSLNRKESTRSLMRKVSFRRESPTSPSAPTPFSHVKRRSRELVISSESVKLTQTDIATYPLIAHAQAGLYTECKKFLDQGEPIEKAHEGSGRTALAVAAHCGFTYIVDLLLQHGASPNSKDSSGQTPLHLAASRGYLDAARSLLEYRADVDAADLEGKTPLRLACDGDFVQVAMQLLRARAKVNVRDSQKLTALHVAAKEGSLEMVKLLQANGADIDAKDGSLMSAIHFAAERNHDFIVEELVDKKNIDSPGKNGMTPLACAAACGATETVRLLIKKGAALRSKAWGGLTPLHWASMNGHSDVVNHLLLKRVPVDSKTLDGRTPLHLAVRSNNFSTAELLVRRGASLEAKCGRSMRPLHYACEADDFDLIQLLIGCGAERYPSDNFIHVAARAGSLRCLNYWLDCGVSADATDRNGDRPLHIAAKKGHFEAVQSLLHHGASLEQRDGWDWTPLACAACYGHSKIVQLLLTRGAYVRNLDDIACGWKTNADGTVRIGFAMDADVSDEEKATILAMLKDANGVFQRQRPVSRAFYPIRNVNSYTGAIPTSPVEVEVPQVPRENEVLPGRVLEMSARDSAVVHPPLNAEPQHAASAERGPEGPAQVSAPRERWPVTVGGSQLEVPRAPTPIEDESPAPLVSPQTPQNVHREPPPEPVDISRAPTIFSHPSRSSTISVQTSTSTVMSHASASTIRPPYDTSPMRIDPENGSSGKVLAPLSVLLGIRPADSPRPQPTSPTWEQDQSDIHPALRRPQAPQPDASSSAVTTREPQPNAHREPTPQVTVTTTASPPATTNTHTTNGDETPASADSLRPEVHLPPSSSNEQFLATFTCAACRRNGHQTANLRDCSRCRANLAQLAQTSASHTEFGPLPRAHTSPAATGIPMRSTINFAEVIELPGDYAQPVEMPAW